LVVLLKAEFVPTIEDRVKEYVKDREAVQDKLKESREDMLKKAKIK